LQNLNFHVQVFFFFFFFFLRPVALFIFYIFKQTRTRTKMRIFLTLIAAAIGFAGAATDTCMPMKSAVGGAMTRSAPRTVFVDPESEMDALLPTGDKANTQTMPLPALPLGTPSSACCAFADFTSSTACRARRPTRPLGP
jgi:hypothetical protein